MPIRSRLLAALFAALLTPAVGSAQQFTVETVDSTTSFQIWGTSVAVDPSGIPHIAYWVPGAGWLYASRNGAPWAIETIASHASPAASAKPAQVDLINVWDSSLAIDASGTPHIASGNENTSSNQIIYWTRDSQGWVEQIPGTNYGSYPRIALDQAGQPRISATQTNSFALELLERNGGTWSVDPQAYVDYSAFSLAIDREGDPHLTYRDAAGYANHLWRDGAGWHAELVDTSQAFAGPIAVGADDVVRTAYVRPDRVLAYAERGPTGWTSSVVSDPGDSVDWVTLALDRHDRPRVAFRDDAGQRLRYGWTNGGAWTFATVAATPDDGVHLSLALGPDGTPHLAWTNISGFRMQYARGMSTTGVPAPPRVAVATLRISPNPARADGDLALAITLPVADRVSFTVIDLAGRRVASREPESFPAGPSARAWQPGLEHPGVYLVRWRSASGASGASRIAVLR